MKRPDKLIADKYGIPKHVRQYAKRYGSSIEMMLATMRKYGSLRRASKPDS